MGPLIQAILRRAGYVAAGAAAYKVGSVLYSKLHSRSRKPRIMHALHRHVRVRRAAPAVASAKA